MLGGRANRRRQQCPARAVRDLATPDTWSGTLWAQVSSMEEASLKPGERDSLPGRARASKACARSSEGGTLPDSGANVVAREVPPRLTLRLVSAKRPKTDSPRDGLGTRWSRRNAIPLEGVPTSPPRLLMSLCG